MNVIATFNIIGIRHFHRLIKGSSYIVMQELFTIEIIIMFMSLIILIKILLYGLQDTILASNKENFIDIDYI